MAPHISEELWQIMGKEYSIHNQKLPTFDESLTISDTIKLVLQVNGKLRDTVEIPLNLNKNEIEKLALESDNVKKHTADKEIVKIIYVKDKLLNIVVK